MAESAFQCSLPSLAPGSRNVGVGYHPTEQRVAYSWVSPLHRETSPHQDEVLLACPSKRGAWSDLASDLFGQDAIKGQV
jgi:hypothetical protein